MKSFHLYQSEQDPETFFLCRPDGTCKEFESGSLRWLVEDLEHTLSVESGGLPASGKRAAKDVSSVMGEAPTLSGQRSTPPLPRSHSGEAVRETGPALPAGLGRSGTDSNTKIQAK